MRVLLLLASWAFLCKSQTHKCLLVSKFTQLVTGFLTAEQISRGIDIAAIGVHNGKGVDEIIEDLADLMQISLSVSQLKTISHSYKGLVKDLGDEGAATVIDRTKKILSYGLGPFINQVRINSQTPETTYKSMLEQLNQPLITGIVHLIHDTLTPQEWTSFSHRFNNIINLNI